MIDKTTGHPEIDRQHVHLADLIESLETFCKRIASSGSPCRQCPSEHQSACSDHLAELYFSLFSFLIDHFTFEDRLMRFLPNTDASRAHVEAHQFAHAEISSAITKLAAELDRANPRDSALKLHAILATWLGNHGMTHDAGLLSACTAEISLDKELSALIANAQ